MSGRLFRSTEADEYHFAAEGCYILERLNDPADPEVSIARARVPAGGATRRHWLAGTTERYLILAGQGEAEIGDQRIRVAPGDVLLIPPEVPQRITNTGDADLVFLAICSPRFAARNYHS